MGVSFQVTLTGVTQIVPGGPLTGAGNAQGTCAPFLTMTVQNQATGNAQAWLALGAANVGSQKGISLVANTGSFTYAPGGPYGNTSDATLWYLFGTNGNKIDVTLT